jgi:hypothetical protein
LTEDRITGTLEFRSKEVSGGAKMGMDKHKDDIQKETTRREFAKRGAKAAYMAPLVLAAIKATESGASAQAPFESPRPVPATG